MALPTSSPVSFDVGVPGTYVFYAVLIKEDSYHFGATECTALSDYHSNGLVALDVMWEEDTRSILGIGML
jgi:hypothetical protein